MRENCTSGSVAGAPGNRSPYAEGFFAAVSGDPGKNFGVHLISPLNSPSPVGIVVPQWPLDHIP